ncbi:hypothetical protein E2C01_050041 [Portunus trituberculatus]|uniref:Uncharacterized protein n=1 Tax=Portunus trituberculatus TaxID=210409 RepID=A0A5B7GF10_PORTR|nr:hypothetical protein [Portunus trituberculatus]
MSDLPCVPYKSTYLAPLTRVKGEMLLTLPATNPTGGTQPWLGYYGLFMPILSTYPSTRPPTAHTYSNPPP